MKRNFHTYFEIEMDLIECVLNTLTLGEQTYVGCIVIHRMVLAL